MAVSADKAMKDIEARLKANKVSGKEAQALLAKLLPLLRRRTRKLVELAAFVNGVTTEDRLYVVAWGVWRRKEIVKNAPDWVRANAPELAEVVVGTPPDIPPNGAGKKVEIRVKSLTPSR